MATREEKIAAAEEKIKAARANLALLVVSVEMATDEVRAAYVEYGKQIATAFDDPVATAQSGSGGRSSGLPSGGNGGSGRSRTDRP